MNLSIFYISRWEIWSKRSYVQWSMAQHAVLGGFVLWYCGTRATTDWYGFISRRTPSTIQSIGRERKESAGERWGSPIICHNLQFGCIHAFNAGNLYLLINWPKLDLKIELIIYCKLAPSNRKTTKNAFFMKFYARPKNNWVVKGRGQNCTRPEVFLISYLLFWPAFIWRIFWLHSKGGFFFLQKNSSNVSRSKQQYDITKTSGLVQLWMRLIYTFFIKLSDCYSVKA